jgi:RNA polymerase sigma-70 factor (ECF subfamily)
MAADGRGQGGRPEARAEEPERGRRRSESGVTAKPISMRIERAKRRDPAALTEFFQAHSEHLTAYFAGPRHWPWQHVADLVQETLAQAIKSFPSFRGVSEEDAERWLFSIARNVHLQEVSRQVGIRLRLEVAGELARQSPHPYETPWYVGDLRDALEELPLGHLEVLRLRLQGLTIREIAAQLDVPEGTVATRIHRAKRQLRLLLGVGVPD